MKNYGIKIIQPCHMIGDLIKMPYNTKEKKRQYQREYMARNREKESERKTEEAIRNGDLNYGLKPLREFETYQNWQPEEGTEKTMKNYIAAKVEWSRNWVEEEEEKPRPKSNSEKDNFGVVKRFRDSDDNSTNREVDFDMDIKSIGDKSQRPVEPESAEYHANPWGNNDEDVPKPKKRTNQDRLKSEFGDFAE